MLHRDNHTLAGLDGHATAQLDRIKDATENFEGAQVLQDRGEVVRKRSYNFSRLACLVQEPDKRVAGNDKEGARGRVALQYTGERYKEEEEEEEEEEEKSTSMILLASL